MCLFSFYPSKGTNVCPIGWTKEYSGHIMGGHPAYTGNSEYVCVDVSDSPTHSSSQSNPNLSIIYYILVKCGKLSCPPYADEKMLTCVVCSK